MGNHGKRILVAEDNLAMAGVVRFNLEQAGLEVMVARCGRSAWEMLRQEDFDLVIVDVQMPGLNGTQLCERMRLVPRLADVPVILLTAKGLELDVRYHQEQLDVRSIISKPFSPRELLGLVQKHLEEGPEAEQPPSEGAAGMSAAGTLPGSRT